MPAAGIYGKNQRQPFAMTSWDIADEPTNAMMRGGGANPGGVRSPYMGGGGGPGGYRDSGAGIMGAGRMAAPMGGNFAQSALGAFRGASRIGGGNEAISRNFRGGMNYTPPPSAPWDPDDPFGGAANLQDPIRALIASGGREGVFGPDYLAKQMRGRAMRNADAGRQRTRTLAGLMQLDPMQQRGAMMDADIAANQSTVGALNEAELMGMSGYQDLIRNLLNRERYGVEAPGEESNIGRRFEEEQQGGLGGFLGQAAGGALGALTGGIGRSLGRRLGGGRSGSVS